MAPRFLKPVFLAAAIGGTAVGVNTCVTPDPATEDAKIIETVCNADAPLMIVDFFSAHTPEYGEKLRAHTMDINGDLQKDMSHGDFVKIIAGLNGRRTIAYGYELAAGESYESFTGKTSEPTLHHLADGIRNGTIERPAAIILSTTKSRYIGSLAYSIGGIMELTPENIRAKKDAVIDRIKSLYESNSAEAKANKRYVAPLYRTLQTVDEIVNGLGVPIITAAGNDRSKDMVNLLALFGATPVGALTHDGQEKTTYTNDNTLTTLYRPGDIIVRQLEGGVDLDNNGTVDIPSKDLSDGHSMARIFNGMPLKTLLRPVQAREDTKSRSYPAYMFDTVRLLSDIYRIGFQAQLIENEKRYEKEAQLYGEYTHLYSGAQFRDDGTGKLIFDPANDGDTSQIDVIQGTSFAAPNICN